MRGGRNIAALGTKAGHGAFAATTARATYTGMKVRPQFGRLWNPQQAQIPLQVSGATG